MARGQDTGNHPGRKVDRGSSWNPMSSPFYNPAIGGVGPTFTRPPLGGAPGGGQSSRPAGPAPIRPNPHGATRPAGEW
jgi:hypothetical protein